MEDALVIGDKQFHSRLIVGTGKYSSPEVMVEAIEASGSQIITVAIRRLNLEERPEKTILDYFDWDKYQLLPNTAGCQTVEEALYVARLARSLGITNWIKLEVISDPKYLLPDPVGTLEAARALVQEGFVVLPYINDDPVLATKLQELGTATVMPLASPIGSGQGIPYFGQIQIIREQCSVPVVVDAGLGAPSDAALSLELGCDAVLVNSAIALARDPVQMAEAFRLGVEAGRMAFVAGRIPKKAYAAASSPLEGVPTTAQRGA